MPPIIDSFIVLAVILVIARFIKRGSTVLQKLFIPSSLVAGVGALLLGPQVLETIPSEITAYWATFPKYLINIVFAGLFLGKVIPKGKDLWRKAAPMLAFGNTLAWGQYVIGIGLTMLILTPIFGTNPLAGSLIEVSFEGGHGTAAGLAPTFEQLGWAEGTDIALGLATFSIIMAVLCGIFLINLHNRHRSHLEDEDTWQYQQKQLIKNGYNLISLTNRFNTNPKAILLNLAAFILAILIGWGLLEGLIALEEAILGKFTDIRFFTYLPLFPLAMIGGLLLQLLLRKLGKERLIQRRTAQIFSSIALDLLIASAIATISLSALRSNIEVFVVLGIAGFVWILGSFIVLAPRMFPEHWFENGITNTGQSMGMTATGLLMNRLADPGNKVKARESFAYKQLLFEPFMGGGIITATSLIVIHEFGSTFALISAAVFTLFWLIFGLYLGRRH